MIEITNNGVITMSIIVRDMTDDLCSLLREIAEYKHNEGHYKFVKLAESDS